MDKKRDRPLLIDFYALSGTGKSTHSEALHQHFTAAGFKSQIVGFSLRRSGRKGSFEKLQRQPVSTFIKSMRMGFTFMSISPRRTSISDLIHLTKWSYRLQVYNNQIRWHLPEGLDYAIMDPCLSSKLNKFYKYFDETSIIDAISLLEKSSMLSDILVIIEADPEIVMKRRETRGTPGEKEYEYAVPHIRRSFDKINRKNSSMSIIKITYNDYSELEGNIQKISELCINARSSE